ncbi:type II secretion system F family protein [Janibacter cremeus]|uniref:type II secretion system F family protein n=1 Tax=Janibacter cremeus TaxID=1285192 RepID=UPI0023F82147|nr:type II secretion system F family protein [Janibacter cremeus]WEV77351.1 type II secretion system F family protein [Janibacter cremeus]
MTVPVIIGGSVLAVLLVVLGVRDLVELSADRRRAVLRAESTRLSDDASLLEDLDRRLGRTRLGRWLKNELDIAGVVVRPVLVLAGAVGVGVVVTYVLWNFVAPTLALLGLVAGYLALRWYLQREQVRRREKFTAQLPELARVLANASYAGLSMPTAVAIAGDELTEPARTELGRVANAMKFGASLDSALAELKDRVGTRESNVLISTLIVSARSGGSLVSALRDIAEALDQRKETRREVQTVLSQAVATSNMIVLVGFAILFLLNAIEAGTVQKMTTDIVGQVVLITAGLLFALGVLAIRRMTKVE